VIDNLYVLVRSPHPQRDMALRSAGLLVVDDESVLDDQSQPLVGVLEGTSRDDAVATLARWRACRPELRVVVLADEEWTGLEASDVTVMCPPVTAGDIIRAIDDLLRAAPTLAAVDVQPLQPGASISDGRSNRRQAVSDLVNATDIVGTVRQAIGSHQPLPAVAEGLCSHLTVRPGGDVAVLELRSTGVHVLAGVGLRPLEWRDLDEPPDVLTRLSGQHPAIVVSDTDALRSGLGMLPLGRHRAVLIARSPEPGCLVVVLGREAGFSKTDVRTVLHQLTELEDGIRAAIQLRAAAALLIPFAID